MLKHDRDPKKMLVSNRLIFASAVIFFIFIVWIITISNAGDSNVFIDSVRAIPYGDKLGHLSLYAVLAALVHLSIKKPSRKHFGLPLGCALVLVFALFEELSQGFFPNTRTLDVGDALADLIGVYLAGWITRTKLNG